MGDSPRYVETPPDPASQDRPFRLCRLLIDGSEKPVSSLRLLSLRVRFGAVAVEAEGFCGVQTLPEHRGKGYARRIIEESLAGARTRVPVVLLYGIEGLYGKFGFVTCLANSSLTLWVGRLLDARFQRRFEETPLTFDEAPAMTELFNAANRLRPWSLVRRPRIPRLAWHDPVWVPSPHLMAVREGGKLAAYAILEGESYGHAQRSCIVHEAVAVDVEAARFLLVAIARRCWERRIAELVVEEPPDAAVGLAARQVGCEARIAFAPDGEGMAAILDREALLHTLAPELARREHVHSSGGEPRDPGALELPSGSRAAFDDLCARRLVADDGELLRLLLGYHSWRDAEAVGAVVPDAARAVLDAWFPGGGSIGLPMGFAHFFDRY